MHLPTLSLTTHQKRLATGLFMAAILGYVIYRGGWTLRWAVDGIACLALWEFLCLYWPEPTHRKKKAFGIIFGGHIVVVQALGPFMVLASLAMILGFITLMYLWEFHKTNGEARFGHFSPLINGLIYIPFMLHLGLYLTPAEQCMALGAAISADIGGYYAGTLWGGKKLWPLVSPNKTWAGFFGGFALCVSLCSALGWIGNAHGWALLSLPWWAWPIAGALLHLGAVVGDLFESALKRSLNAKDTGSILPGHGGMLDRIDSILWVVPLYLCLREFILWCLSTWQALLEMGIV